MFDAYIHIVYYGIGSINIFVGQFLFSSIIIYPCKRAHGSRDECISTQSHFAEPETTVNHVLTIILKVWREGEREEIT